LDETNLPLISGDLYERADTVAQLQFGARASNFVSSQGLSRIVLLYALATISTVIAAPGHFFAQSPDAALRLEAKIPLGDVRGRIDHMAADVNRRRLFVAELGNNTVGIVDVGQGKAFRTLGGQKEPQGVGYVAGTDTLFIANGGDGSVRLFQGPNYTANGRIDLGDDADNVRVDPSNQHVVVGYGDGALAVIDGAARNKVGEVRLPAHPEGFQLDSDTGRVYVNIPNAHSMAVVDLPSRKVVAIWPASGASANFPMAIDNDSSHVLAVFRNPPKVGVFDKRDGSLIRMVDTCGDADDLFVDHKRHRVYVSCGAGVIDIFDARSYDRLARIPTVSGARTSLFVPELDQLFVAVRAGGSSPAAIWVFRP
jgi:DNA-binding beta-propeller fold protein YncE